MDGRPIDDNDLAYDRHRIVNSMLRLSPAQGDYLRYALVYLLEDKGPLNVDEICAALEVDSEDWRRRVQRFLS